MRCVVPHDSPMFRAIRNVGGSITDLLIINSWYPRIVLFGAT